tara:strand:+ start:718 stop:888 length:171 start_codon:yes stop_codon:yes gene_type:complete
MVDFHKKSEEFNMHYIEGEDQRKIIRIRNNPYYEFNRETKDFFLLKENGGSFKLDT